MVGRLRPQPRPQTGQGSLDGRLGRTVWRQGFGGLACCRHGLRQRFLRINKRVGCGDRLRGRRATLVQGRVQTRCAFRRRVEPIVPAAPQSAIRIDQADDNRTFGLGQQVLVLHQVLFQSGHAIEVDHATPVLHDRDVHGTLSRCDGIVELVRLLLRFEKRDQSVLGLLGSRDHGKLIRRHELLKQRVLRSDVVQNAAEVQHVPLERRAADRLLRALVEQISVSLGRILERAVQIDVRVELGLGNADLLGLRGSQSFGHAHVGTAAEQVGRHANGHFRRRCGNGCRADPGNQVLRRDTQQNAQCVVRLPQRDFQCWDLRLGLREDALRLIDVERRDLPSFETGRDQRQDRSLQLDIGPRIGDLGLKDADLRVIGRHVTQHGDQHIVVVLDRGVEVVVGGNDRAPQPAPEVELPRHVEARVVLAKEPLLDEAAIGQLRADGVVSVVADRLKRLRKQAADGHAQYGACLQNAICGLAQSQILAVGIGHQTVEHRIVEHRPPVRQIVGLLAHPHVVVVDPVFRDRCRWTLIVGTDLETVMHIFGPTGAAGAGDQ